MTTDTAQKLTLPDYARLPVNRCNLPAEVLGDLSFQSNPKPLLIDGIKPLHNNFFQQLNEEADASVRSQWFKQYMSAHFLLDSLDDAGYDPEISIDRSRANYLRVLRGWYFDSDSREGAIIKAWVESRFGLIPRYHRGPVRSIEDDNYRFYISQSARGLYNTNALEAQLDLLYSFCQHELRCRYAQQKTVLLYRGQNHLQSLELLEGKKLNTDGDPEVILLLNNISSFTSDAERACEFGDTVIRVKVPSAKLLFFSGLMPGIMSSEQEYAVIGGVYRAELVKDLNQQ